MRKFILLVFIVIPFVVFSQGIRWSKDGNSYYQVESGEIVQYALPANTKSVLVSKTHLRAEGRSTPLSVRNFVFSEDQTQVLIFTNAVKVWREETPAEYVVYKL